MGRGEEGGVSEDKGMVVGMANNTIRVAIKKWFKNLKGAKDTYGEVGLWDVSEVTDMSGLFEGRGRTFKQIQHVFPTFLFFLRSPLLRSAGGLQKK